MAVVFVVWELKVMLDHLSGLESNMLGIFTTLSAKDFVRKAKASLGRYKGRYEIRIFEESLDPTFVET